MVSEGPLRRISFNKNSCISCLNILVIDAYFTIFYLNLISGQANKALGTGLRMGIAWRDMSVTNLSSGQPVMEITGWAKNRLDEMTPSDHEAIVHVSLTDDHPWAQAYVIIEARPLA